MTLGGPIEPIRDPVYEARMEKALIEALAIEKPTDEQLVNIAKKYRFGYNWEDLRDRRKFVLAMRTKIRPARASKATAPRPKAAPKQSRKSPRARRPSK